MMGDFILFLIIILSVCPLLLDAGHVGGRKGGLGVGDLRQGLKLASPPHCEYLFA